MALGDNPSLTVETGTGADTQSSVDFGLDGKGNVRTSQIAGMSMTAVDPEMDAAEAKPPTEAEIAAEIAKEVAAGEAEGATPEAKPEDAAQPEAKPLGEPVEDLGEYKADDPATIEKFEGRYFTEEGKLDKDALAAEFWGNATTEQPGALHEGTYAFLEQRLGISKDVVKDIEAALVSQAQTQASGFTQQVYEAAGGQPAWDAAVAWATKGGYTPEQGNRLNHLIQTRAEGWQDAVEALVARYGKANPQAQRTAPPPPPARRSSPARIAGAEPQRPAAPQQKETTPKQEEGPTALPYASADEYMKDLGAALKDGPARMAEVRARLKASPNVRM